MLMIRILNLNLDSNGLIEPDFNDPVYIKKGSRVLEYDWSWKKNNTYNKSLSGFFLVP